MIYYLSDTHFGHNREFIWKSRGFCSIEEHDEILVENFNKVVKTNDTVYFLGDFTYGDPIKYFLKLNCNNWFWVHGNHDGRIYQALKYTGRIKHYVFGYMDININKQKLTLSHFPMLAWEQSHRGAVNVYGHLHGREIPIKGKMIDVGMDCINNTPISHDELIERVKLMPEGWDSLREKA